MLRLAVMVAFTVSLFDGRVCPMPQKEESNTNVTVSATNARKNVSDILTNNSTEELRSPVKLTDNERDTVKGTLKLNETKKLTTSEHLSIEAVQNTEPTVMGGHKKEKHFCNSTKEQIDMLSCVVSPHDDDDDDDDDVDDTDNTTQPNATESTTSRSTAKHDGVQNSTESVKFVPIKVDNNTSIKTIQQTTIAKLNQSIYVTVPSTMDHSVNSDVSEVSGTDTKLSTNHSEVLISSAEAQAVNNIQTMASQSVNEVGKSTQENNDKSMPSGIIALVTAITFAVAAVVAYISMIAWRRYLEYRYGHRELLVNELEFDTNDLRHFEL